MKLIHLTMTALGPYKDTQVIDFTELEDRKLFVISGATGAGKTTIFDAITFALYGTASGSDRENVMMLRSHFASDDVHTAVQLIFKLHDRTYRVLRQLGHVKEGNKTKTGDRYELYEITDAGEKPAVDRQIVTEINEKIEELIGLTVEQFKQIVMLPQGEFRELLTSETANKEAILRRIFQTERYQQMNELLHDKQTILEQQYSDQRERLNRYIDRIHTSLEKREESKLFTLLEEEYYQIKDVLTYLQTEIQYYESLIKKDEKLYQQSVDAYEKYQKQTTYAQVTNKQFDELGEKQTELAKLNEQKTTIEHKEEQLQQAERASEIEPYETQFKARQKEVATIESKVKQLMTKSKTAQQTVEQAKETYEREKNKTTKREQLTEQLLVLKKYVPIVQTIEVERKVITNLKKQLKEQSQQVEALSNKIKSAAKQLETTQAEETKLVTALEGHTAQQMQHNELQTAYKWWQQLVEALQTYEKLKKSFKEKKATYEKAAEGLKKIEKQWIEQQAAVLAESLVDGDACPVCGSHHHPNKQHEQTDFISDEQLEEKQRQVQQFQTNFYHAQTEVTSAKHAVEQIKAQLEINTITLAEAIDRRDTIVTEGKQSKVKLDKYKAKETKLKSLREQLKTLQPTYETLITQKEALEKEKSKKEIEKATKVATFNESIREIPEEHRTLTVLEKKIGETEALKNRLEKAWQQATEQLKQAEMALTKSETELENSQTQLKEAHLAEKETKQLFITHVEKAHFSSVEHYNEAKLPTPERKQLKKQIDAYHQTVVTLEKQITDLKTTLKHKKRADLDAMQQQLQSLKERYEQAFQAMNQSQQLKEKAIEIKEKIASSQKEVASLEKQVVNVKDVYDALRGQNSKRISFERYLQIDYLDQIIYAANSRFKKLTDGQYHLVRSERQESHGRQSGLTIDVYDGYTGQMRDVKTLSGGEKFIASLCLALGMSDVIQSFQGNIRIDTMFIDEGFGSLDEESLHKSIDALIQLQKTGRIIGVISHVNEIKQLFPARLEVTKTKEGHSSASFVLR